MKDHGYKGDLTLTCYNGLTLTCRAEAGDRVRYYLSPTNPDRNHKGNLPQSLEEFCRLGLS